MTSRGASRHIRCAILPRRQGGVQSFALTRQWNHTRQIKATVPFCIPDPYNQHVRTLSTAVAAETTVAAEPTEKPSTPIDEPNKQQHSSSGESEQDIKTRILGASLKQVAEHGWTRDAIVAAVRTEFPHVSPSLAGTVVPNDMVAFAMDEWNRRLLHELEDPKQQLPTNPVDRIVFALRRRLEYQKEMVACRRWQEAMAMGISTPDQAFRTTQQLKELIQTVLKKSLLSDDGKQISELGQVGLGAVYAATEFHMLADTSQDYPDTWVFLRSRVQEWHQALVNSKFTGLPFLPYGGSNTVTLASAVASAFASAVLSVVQVNPNDAWSSFSKNMVTTPFVTKTTASQTPGPSMDGTSPDHYVKPSQ